jgi:signal transduction histidine kinase/PAS domain-containing protein
MAAGLVALAWWQGAPGWGRVLAVVVATTAAVGVAPRVAAPRWLAWSSTGALVLATLVAVLDTQRYDRVSRAWPAWSAAEQETRANRVASALEQWGVALRADADRALADWTGAAPPSLSRPAGPGGAETALLAFEGGRLVARAGQLRTAVQPGREAGVRLVEGTFHSSLVAVARRGGREVMAVGLVAAAPPADRLALSLLRALAPGADAPGVTEVESPDSSSVLPRSTVVLVPDGPRRLARVRTLPLPSEATRLELLQQARLRTGALLLVALAGWLVVAWRRPARTGHRLLAALGGLALVAVAPLSSLSNVSPLFDPASYFVAGGGPFTATLAGLLGTAVLGLVVCLAVLRTAWQRPSRPLAGLLVAVIAVGGPYLLRDLARGIAWPAAGAGLGLWVGWQLALALVAACLMATGAAAGRAALGRVRGGPAAVAPLLALACAGAAPFLWESPGRWPDWFTVPWIVAITALAFTRRGGAQVVAAAVVAGSGAVTLAWGSSVRARQALAAEELARLSQTDENATRLLVRLALEWGELPARGGRGETLVRRYAASELARAGYPARLVDWTPASYSVPAAAVTLAPVVDTLGVQAGVAALARTSGEIELRTVPDGPATLLVAAIPGADGFVTTVAVPPRTRLLPADPFRLLTGVSGAVEAPPPFRLALLPAAPGDRGPTPVVWRRVGATMRGDAVAGEPPDLRRVLVEVPMGGPDALWTRGVLLIAIDVGIVLALWLLTGVADGGMGRLLAWRRRRWRRSFRVRLSGALVGFFLAPALAFAAWGGLQLQDNDRAARELLLREALRVAEAERAAGQFGAAPSATGAPLFLYEGGVLAGASDPLLAALAPLGRLLPGALGAADSFSPDERFVTARVPVGVGSALVGYRQLDAAGGTAVLATPARGDEFALDARRSDLGLLVLCVALLGALAAVAASGWAARTLAEPVRALREAALALAAGRRPRLPGTAPTSEFVPVYQAFGRMARDLAASRAALEASQRQTAAVLEQVASGVLALDQQGGVVLVNPQAAELLGMPAGVVARAEAGGPAPAPALPPAVAPRCLAFLAGSAPDDEFDLVLAGRQLRGRLTRLAGGAVLTVDDVTALASAQRVLAWGEMARQVAHEIKNPLTPIRLGVQHLRRAFRDGRSDFAQVLDTNVSRVLAEIDRLDGIARAFSRYGTAPEARAALEAVDVGRVAADVVALEQLGHDGPVHWALEVRAAEGEAVCAHGRAEELAKVLLNLLENARLADARAVRVTVSATGSAVTVVVTDDGTGIAPEVLPRVFEPHFSTRTSGSGLGLAISRRLVEGWGGTLVLESVLGTGTTARLSLPRCPADAPDT